MILFLHLRRYLQPPVLVNYELLTLIAQSRRIGNSPETTYCRTKNQRSVGIHVPNLSRTAGCLLENTVQTSSL